MTRLLVLTMTLVSSADVVAQSPTTVKSGSERFYARVSVGPGFDLAPRKDTVTFSGVSGIDLGVRWSRWAMLLEGAFYSVLDDGDVCGDFLEGRARCAEADPTFLNFLYGGLGFAYFAPPNRIYFRFTFGPSFLLTEISNSGNDSSVGASIGTGAEFPLDDIWALDLGVRLSWFTGWVNEDCFDEECEGDRGETVQTLGINASLGLVVH